MIRKIIAITLGLFVSILLAVAVGIVVAIAAYLDFWRGLFGTLSDKPFDPIEETKPMSVWDHHIARLDYQNKNEKER